MGSDDASQRGSQESEGWPPQVLLRALRLERWPLGSARATCCLFSPATDGGRHIGDHTRHSQVGNQLVRQLVINSVDRLACPSCTLARAHLGHDLGHDLGSQM